MEKEDLIEEYNSTITALRQFSDELRETEHELISEKEDLMRSQKRSNPLMFDIAMQKLRDLSKSMEMFRSRPQAPCPISEATPRDSEPGTSTAVKYLTPKIEDIANSQITVPDFSDFDGLIPCLPENENTSEDSRLVGTVDANSIEEHENTSEDSRPVGTVDANSIEENESILSDLQPIISVDTENENLAEDEKRVSNIDTEKSEVSPDIIWDNEPSLVKPITRVSLSSEKRKSSKRKCRRSKATAEEEIKGEPTSSSFDSTEVDDQPEGSLDNGSPVNSQRKMPRIISSDEEQGANSTEDNSDASVVDDEDLELENAIRAEKAKKKKTGTPKENANRKVVKNGKEDSDSDVDKLLRKANACLKKGTVGSADSLDELLDEDEGVPETSKQSKEAKLNSQEKKKKSIGIFSKTKSKHFGQNGNSILSKTEKSPSASGEEKEDLESDVDEPVKSKGKKTTDKRLAALLKSTRNILMSDDDDDDDEDEDEESEPKKTNSSVKRNKRRLVESSEGSAEEDEQDSDKDDDDDDDDLSHKTSKKMVTIDSSEEEADSDKAKKKATGTVKKIMGKSKLAQGTRDAEQAEKERRKRLEQKQKEFNGIELADGPDLEAAITGSQSAPKLKSVVLDPDKDSDPSVPVAVHAELVAILKPHQAKGIQFMYDSAYESVDRLDEEGGGGILAHCMGLGKTLQVITFLHTVMTHPKIGKTCKRALVVVPKNVVLNWFKEFSKWLDRDGSSIGNDLNILELDSVKNHPDRLSVLKNWYRTDEASVLIIGYDMFRILTHDEEDMKKKRGPPKKKAPVNSSKKKLDKLKIEFRKYLQDPGPDIVVCDEAHKLKNDESALSKTMVKIKTKRRLCLTGTPLQNNLMEYHCMVNFVKPGLLGTKNEFSNRFANIINRGRLKDASQLEVKFMRRRCHVLFEHLKKCVDRKDYTVLQEAIPPKQEYVVNIRMTERQCQLYRAFLDNVVNSEDLGLTKRLLPDYHVLSRVWTHPYQLVLHEQKQQRERLLKEEAAEEDDFIDDESGSGTVTDEARSDSDVMALDSDDDIQEISGKNREKLLNSRKSRRLEGEKPEMEGRDTETPPEYNGWFAQEGLVSNEDQQKWELSNKLVLLTAILKKCEEIGDKILVFSQSLESLSLIRRMLEYFDCTNQWFTDGHEACKAAGETWGWKEGRDFMVIDGSVQSGKRDAVQTKFNNVGTNMVAANRVIIFDACWNPSHDTQSLFRVYRFGQTKPVYIYRFIAQGTMEERIYKRQVTKESTSMRVVDEAQIQRHYEGHDLDELYRFDPNELNKSSPESLPAFAPPKDRLLADVLLAHRDCVVSYFQHDTLFAHAEEEKLSEEELKEAWEDYEREKNNIRPAFNQNNYNQAIMQMQLQRNQQMINQNLRQALARDPIYLSSFSVGGMEEQTALQVAYLKQSLEKMLPKIPIAMRGGINEFNSFFMNFITQANAGKLPPQWLLNKSISTFRTVVKMVKSIPECQQDLRMIYQQNPQFFDPSEPF